ncbi:DeoR/GlpR family DNA-binding transcription regulator [Bacillus sp. V2I10]|uniref:DeoR/GlpR family DNA-binding transcription regulator n=1 Tax=Bacillus sp. V2I10 TaxID=3042276 RepID=UPI00207ADB83|nr:DeoR/GlpR family DNA-binding transcription regulator [Bacillus sp. V2I10]MDQ0860374.1 DeoR/GlpR family transcriptional regulator of sugar metabolism [Bacillus sp. V2I10]USK35477.1 DeoR/GlpR family DNA-binding transcription regulator [Bacillus sp. F19]
MYQEERLLKILHALNEKQMLSNDEICEMLHISRDTARRDIVKLAEQGAAVRTHGGIALPIIKEEIQAYKNRLTSFSKEKHLIGKYSAGLIGNHDLCFFDVSTTIKFLCDHLETPATIYTHSLDNAESLSENENADFHLLGGRLDRTHRFFYEPEFRTAIESITFDKAFIGACAIGEDGIYYETKEDRIIKKTAAERSKQVFLLADYNKFNQESKYRAFDFSMIHVLVTDRRPPAKFQEILREHNVKIMISK